MSSFNLAILRKMHCVVLIVVPDLVVLGGLFCVVGLCRAGYRLLLQLSMYVCV
jgi:hypothetical protein